MECWLTRQPPTMRLPLSPLAEIWPLGSIIYEDSPHLGLHWGTKTHSPRFLNFVAKVLEIVTLCNAPKSPATERAVRTHRTDAKRDTKTQSIP